MSHFASTNWNNPSGVVAYMSTLATAMQTATGSTSTEGTNKLSYTTVRAGMYRVSSYVRVSTASNAATSHTGVVQVAYNNGTAITAANIQLNGVTATATTNLKSTAGTTVLAQSSVIYAASATSIAITVSETVSGAVTAGAYDLTFVIEAV
jgi:hypothetical protein